MVTWVEIAGGATIFGLIVAIAAWLNGGRTTKVLGAILQKHEKILTEHTTILREILSELKSAKKA